MSDSETKSWLCTVCGYVHQGDAPPECCPVCGAPSSDFQPYLVEPPKKQAAPVAQWRCINCNYVHDGTQPPDFCPVCGSAPDGFEAVVKSGTEGYVDEAVRVVIIGGGIAGVSAAESVCESAPQSSVVLLCQEAVLPYYRLNLTRYLAKEIESGSLQMHDASWYKDKDIDLRLDCNVTGLSLDEKKVEMADGEAINYDRLILSMGSHAFVPPIPGSDLGGVTPLRTANDADDIIKRIGTNGRCIVIGGGILGLETAGALGKQGASVTLIESHDWLMPRQLNCKAAALLEKHMAGLGVVVKKNAKTRRIIGDDRVLGIELEGGECIDAEVVILATGVRPNTALARKAGLEVNRGIVVDNNLITSDPDVYAAGDVAEHNGQLYGAWAPSQYQGSIAGLNACGVFAEFGGLPRSNALKVLGIDMLSIGQFEPEDGSYIIFDAEEGDSFANFVFRDGKMVGAILMNHPDLGPRVKHSVEEKVDFSGVLLSASSGLDIIACLNEQR